MRRAFLLIVGGAGALVLLFSIRELIRTPVGSGWFVLVGLTMATAWSTLRMRNVQVSFSISDTFPIAGALLFGPAAGTVLVMLEALVASLRVAQTNKSGMWVRRARVQHDCHPARHVAGRSPLFRHHRRRPAGQPTRKDTGGHRWVNGVRGGIFRPEHAASSLLRSLTSAGLESSRSGGSISPRYGCRTSAALRSRAYSS